MRSGPTLLVCALLAAGCGSSPLVPDKTLFLTSEVSVNMAGVAAGAVAAAAIYFIYDPLAPNWEIEEARLADDTYRLSLRMKRYHTGGAGESIQIVKRRAAQLQSQMGYGSYQLLEYSEGIESQTLGARRVADGVVKLVNLPTADSFLQNIR
jgi:hypothetical protein